MFDWRDDICCCASQDCPHKDNCVRAIQYHKPGVHTVSDFYHICREDYVYYIKENDEE